VSSERDPIPAKTELARELTRLAKKGPPELLATRLAEDPWIAQARIDDGTCIRSMLHLATDWPGKRQHAATIIRLLVEAGCDPNVRAEGPHGETALHWAASADDVPAVRALIECGADLEIDGAVIGGLTAMADAVAFGQWDAAEYLLELGATVTFWQAAGLGLVDVVAREAADHDSAEITHAFWVAASSGRRDTAELLLEHGAEPDVVGIDDLTPAQAARRSGHDDLAAWIDALAD
jgi:ankyrin repeat protein